MDIGRARFRQAHKLPPRGWEAALLAVNVIIILALVAHVMTSTPNG